MRVCDHCGDEMPPGKRSHARFCSTSCRVMAHGSTGRARAHKRGNPVEMIRRDETTAYFAARGWTTCFYCTQPFTPADPMHVDHFIPVAKGGAHRLNNLVPAHASCNLRKSDKHPLSFISSLQDLPLTTLAG